jgi:hypothetical protein
VTRNADRLEILARDLASRYGEDDHLVRGICPRSPSKVLPVGLGHRAWRLSQRHSFKPARLAKLGIGSGA